MAAPSKEIVLTRDTYESYQKKLDYYKTYRRPAVAERIKQAKEYGDLSENAEYEDAKNEQSVIEGTIIELENIIRYAKILDEKEIIKDRVDFGVTAVIKNLGDSKVYEYTLVGSLEADPSNGFISNESPVGKAINGRAVGEVVEIEVPKGLMKYEICRVYKKQKQYE